MSERTFDVIIIGTGTAGREAAGRLAQAGLSLAIVERELVGGECAFYACMPSKSLLRPNEALTEARRIPGAAEAATGQLDVAAMFARRDDVVHHLEDSSYLPGFESQGIALVRGSGRLEGDRRVRVGSDVLVAEKAVIVATGTDPRIPAIQGLREAEPWTNRELTTHGSVPARLAILGGGAVGAEMAQAWCTLGSQVTLIEAMDRLLGREEPFAAEQVAVSLRERGVDLRLGARAASVRRAGGGEVTIELEDGTEVKVDELAVAAGRQPRTDDLGLETVGLEPGQWIDVDDQLRVTGVEGNWLYAIGDVNARALLTHVGKYQARVASDNILGKTHSGDWRRTSFPPSALHRPPGGGGWAHAAISPGRRPECKNGGSRHVRERRRQFLRPGSGRHHAPRDRHRPGCHRRRHDHRLRDRRLSPRSHDRDRRRGTTRARGPRDPVVPDA